MLSHFPQLGLSDAPRATGFVVSVYGDAVLPRGGTLWMGALIETCADQGLSESLVRTAVSRLVASGSLVGERVGRRSYYRLAPKAEAEFLAAERVIFASRARPTGWQVALDAPVPLPQGWAHVAPGVALAPRGVPPLDAVIVDGACLDVGRNLQALAARLWDLSAVAERYRRFVRCFAPLHDLAATELSPRAALALRLRLVHAFRLAVLADPNLPSDALGADFPAVSARQLFATCYSALTPQADAYIAERFVDATGALPLCTPALERRYAHIYAAK